MAAIQTLLVQEGATTAGVVCEDSGWLAAAGDTCPVCGQPTRHTPDVIDALVQSVVGEGGSVKHVEGDTQLKEYTLAAAFASLCRRRVPSVLDLGPGPGVRPG